MVNQRGAVYDFTDGKPRLVRSGIEGGELIKGEFGAVTEAKKRLGEAPFEEMVKTADEVLRSINRAALTELQNARY